MEQKANTEIKIAVVSKIEAVVEDRREKVRLPEKRTAADAGTQDFGMLFSIKKKLAKDIPDKTGQRKRGLVYFGIIVT